MRSTNQRWQIKLEELLDHGMEVSPRGKETREQVAGQYTVPMPAYLSLSARKVNVPFLLAEPAWILSGSNRLKDLMPYMRAYQGFSDDGVFLRGAYGPKIVDQLHYVVDSLAEDPSSRQAYLNIWRERPQKAADIACTTGMQFLIREGALHCVTTMRSQDIVQGFTFDVFTFSCVAEGVRLLLAERGVRVELGTLTVTAGSLHLYRDPFGKDDDQFAKARDLWIPATDEDSTIAGYVGNAFEGGTYEEFRERLWCLAASAKAEVGNGQSSA
jgi:thymidylate synthase